MHNKSWLTEKKLVCFNVIVVAENFDKCEEYIHKYLFDSSDYAENKIEYLTQKDYMLSVASEKKFVKYREGKNCLSTNLGPSNAASVANWLIDFEYVPRAIITPDGCWHSIPKEDHSIKKELDKENYEAMLNFNRGIIPSWKSYCNAIMVNCVDYREYSVCSYKCYVIDDEKGEGKCEI